MMGTLFFRFATNSVFWRRRHRCHRRHRMSNFACLLATTVTTFIIRDFSIIAGTAAYSPSPSHNKQKHQSPTTSTAATATATAAQTNKPKLFAYQHILPPLDKHEFKIDSDSDSSESSSHDYDYDYSQSIPCLYTNNIGSASQWVDEHIYNNCKMAKKTTNMNNINMMSSTKSGDVVEEEQQQQQQQQQIQQPIILGWDMESSPYLPWREYNENSYIGPATLQLSTITNTLVFQIAQDGGGDGRRRRRRRVRPSPLPKFINDLLENSNIIKTGVAIDDDFIELYRWVISIQQQQQEDDDNNNNTITTIPKWASGSASSASSSSSPSGVLRRFDMGKISTTSTSLTKGNQISLGKLVRSILGVTILKSNKLARSPWGRAPLEKEEVTYAARDAWAAAAIMHKLNILNENQFSPKSIIKTLNLYNNIQCNINDISTNQAKRKNLKNEWKELKEYNNNKRNNNNNSSNNKMMNSSSGGVCNNDSSTEEDDKDSEEYDKDSEDEIRELILWNEMKKLAPKSPIEYDISSLPNLFRIE